MAVREITPPARTRTRESRYKYSDKEVADTVKLIKDGKLAGVGPYSGEGNEKRALREARSAAAALARKVKESDSTLDVGTRAWLEDGEAFGAVRLRS